MTKETKKIKGVEYYYKDKMITFIPRCLLDSSNSRYTHAIKITNCEGEDGFFHLSNDFDEAKKKMQYWIKYANCVLQAAKKRKENPSNVKAIEEYLDTINHAVIVSIEKKEVYYEISI